MTGVSIEQWRGSIGIFDSKNTSKKIFKERNDFSGLFLTASFRNLLCLLSLWLKILFRLILLFFTVL